MFSSILIAFVSLIILVSLHELGHLLTAKKFGVRVEEFGLGYPPRLWGKKFGDTLYSLNLLPFGAFVRIPEEPSSEPGSFFGKPLWQRALIVFNGAFAFWLVAAVLFSLVFLLGPRMVIDDESVLAQDPWLQISAVAPHSPAAGAGLKVGDVFQNQNKIKDFQEFVNENKGQEIILTLKRGERVFEAPLTPRINPPAGQGPLGVSLVRTAIKTFPWYQAPFLGVKTTLETTGAILNGYAQALAKIFQGKVTSTPGLELMGPIGIVNVLGQGISLGLAFFLQMIGVLSINVAVINLLPIPAFDGGKLLFLGLEAVRKKPISPKLEQGITSVFFIGLILLMIFVSIKDIKNF